MGLFMATEVPCPICSENLKKVGNKWQHYAAHALPVPGGFSYKCGCGDSGGVLDKPERVAAALILHMQKRHGIAP